MCVLSNTAGASPVVNGSWIVFSTMVIALFAAWTMITAELWIYGLFQFKGGVSMFDWIEEFMEMFGCDWDTAAREYYYTMHPETYNAEDYEEDTNV